MKNYGVYLVALVLGLGACDDLSVGGDGGLEREDVEDIPPGDASGDDVSGAYLFTSFDQRSCSCSAGDPCGSVLDCNAEHQICFEDQCQAGAEVDACQSAIQCSVEAPLCVEGMCYDGSPGDPCTGNVDCKSLMCGVSGSCE